MDMRVQCWNVFGNMTPADDLKDAGEHIKVHGRWHRLNGSSGVCVCECSDAGALNSWMLNWAPICEISVEPIVDDAMARASLQGKPFMLKNPSAESSSDSADDSCSKNDKDGCCCSGDSKKDNASAESGGDSADAAEKSEEAPVDV